ncbi:hypothetical protein BGZ58_007798, partial [Dissophora ornata]
SAYMKLAPKDMDALSSQEVVHLAIYIMKRSRLDFADPLTSEKVHTEGEKKADQQKSSTKTGDFSSMAAQIYLTKEFHIGNSVLHNQSFPISRHMHSAITLATFCARASSLRIQSGPDSGHSTLTVASRTGAKLLAKLGQVIFGEPCSHSGHAHHRRARASLGQLERQNVELDQTILREGQRLRPQSQGENENVAMGQLRSTSSSFATSTKTPNATLGERWCKHCSRAISCLVVATLQESSEAEMRQEGLAILEVETLDAASISCASSSSVGSLRKHHQDHYPILKQESEHSNDVDPLSKDFSSSQFIASHHSHMHDGEDVPLPQPRPNNGQSSLSAPSSSSVPPKFLADSVGSEFAAAPNNNNVPSSGISNGVGSRLKGILKRSSTNSIQASDVELVSRTGGTISPIPAPTETWAVSEELGPDASSPLNISKDSSAFGTDGSSDDRPRTILEMDLAEALTTSAPVLTSALTSVPAVSLGIHPSMESVHEAVSNSRRSSATSSHEPATKEDEDTDSMENQESLPNLQGFSGVTTPVKRTSLPSSPPTIHPTVVGNSHTPPPTAPPMKERDDNKGDDNGDDKGAEHHLFYALGIHNPAPTESYAREIEESLRRNLSSDAGMWRSSESHNSESSEDEVENDLENDMEYGTADDGKERDRTRSGDSESDDLRPDSTVKVPPTAPVTPPIRHVENAAIPQTSEHAESEENNDLEQDYTSPLPPSLQTPKPLTIPGFFDKGNKEDDDRHEVKELPDTDSSSPLSSSSKSTLMTDESFRSPRDSLESSHDDYLQDDDEDEDDGLDEYKYDDPDKFGPSAYALTDSCSSLTEQSSLQRKQEQRRKRRRVRVDDAKRKQEQLDKINAELQLKPLGKIRDRVSFWEGKGVLEQKVVSVVEVEVEEDEEANGRDAGVKDGLGPDTEMETDGGREALSTGNVASPQQRQQWSQRVEELLLQENRGQADDSLSLTKPMDHMHTVPEPTSPGNGQSPGHADAPKGAPPREPLASNKQHVALSDDEHKAFL